MIRHDILGRALKSASLIVHRRVHPYWCTLKCISMTVHTKMLVLVGLIKTGFGQRCSSLYLTI